MPKRKAQEQTGGDDDSSLSQGRRKRARKESTEMTLPIVPEGGDDTSATSAVEETPPGVNIHIHVEGDVNINQESKQEVEDEEYEEFLAELLKQQEEVPPDEEPKPRRSTRSKQEKPAMKLNTRETAYFRSLPPDRQRELNAHMKKISDFMSVETEVPLRFQVLALPVSDYIKANVFKKIAVLEDESGESYKLRNWVDGFLRIPFGKTIPVPVCMEDGMQKCSLFLKHARDVLDKAVYGLVPAKTQILQVLAQWIASPGSVGNVIALQGPAGVGKTSIARQGIAEALHRPFEFFSLGGASDIANFVGHSYTYEGSLWGRVADSLMHAKCMNPVMYFDELDKISNTPHGEEITSMLIHMTDRSQNTQFHDRYFAGVDLDLSQCLFVFSFNDISQVSPILRDRMQIIHCEGYSDKDKKSILKDYVWPQLLQRLRFSVDDVVLPDATMEHLISDYSHDEKGVRNLIRASETIVTRLNMLRIANETVMKDYKFYIPVQFPVTLSIDHCKTLLFDMTAREPESWRTMYN